MNLRHAILLGSLLVLLLALGAGLLQPPPVVPPLKTDRLADLLPRDLPGATGTDQALGATEFLQSRVNTILHYDDFLYRVYHAATWELGVYVAYWKPGSASIFEPEEHTPDVCWVQANWKLEQKEEQAGLKAAGRPLWPARSRVFSQNGQIQHVYFWHTVGHSLYRRSEIPLGGSLLTGWKLRRERLGGQYMVRLSSNVPLAGIWGDPAVQAILKEMGELTLWQH